MRFLGHDADIDIATRHPEFDAWKWTRIESLPETIVAFKQALYVELVRQFKPLADMLAAGDDPGSIQKGSAIAPGSGARG